MCNQVKFMHEIKTIPAALSFEHKISNSEREIEDRKKEQVLE